MLLVNSNRFAIGHHKFQERYYHMVDEKIIFEKMNENIEVNQMFYLSF